MSIKEQFDDPYNPDSDDLQNETPVLETIIQGALDNALYNTHVALPCKVIKVSSSGYVDIQPLLLKKYFDGTLVQIPTIQNCPVVSQRGANYSIQVPVAVGDTGFAIFAERSIDAWTVNGGTVDPQDNRKHDLSDAVFFPGLYPMSQAIPNPDNNLIVKNGTSILTLKPSGEIDIDGGGGAIHGIGLGDHIESRLSALESALSTLASGFGATHTHLAMGPFSPTGPPIPTADPFTADPTPAASTTAKVST